MKRCCILLINILFTFFIFRADAQQVIYYTPVQMPTGYLADNYRLMDTKLVAEDMALLLSAATGKNYTAKIHDGKASAGIFLLLDSNLVLSSNESALVSSDAKKNIFIRARYITGLSYGVYTYLGKLGFKFYLPGDDWIITPKLQHAYLSGLVKEEWKPFFRNRVMAISGGMPGVKGLDEQRKNNREWNTWYRRNRMGSDYLGIDGHIGESFNMENRGVIEKDTAILAPVQGKRQYNTYGKLDPTYPKGVKMFIDWAIEKYRLENTNAPYFLPWHQYQSVDPGDGLDYCHTPECEARFKSISDQVFSVANEAAKKIRIKYPNAGVSLYAYTERADTPGFKLEPNVHVGIVSTAFQHVDMPAALVKRWAKKTKNITLYDYLNIGVWSLENPFFNLESYFAYLRMAKSLNIDGFTFEAAPSKFAAGIQQYFILKYLCSPYDNIQTEFDQFCSLSFGKAAAPVGSMLKEWYFSDLHVATGYDRPTFEDYEIGRFVKKMVEADNLETNDSVKKRLEELKAYLVFAAKKYNYFNNLEVAAQNAKDKNARIKVGDDLLSFSWLMYNRNIFHNTQFNDVMRGLLKADSSIYSKWDYESNSFSRFNINSADYIKKEFLKLKENFLPKALPLFTVDDAFLEKTSNYSADSIRIRLVDEESLSAYTYYIDLYCPAAGKIIIQYSAGTSKLKKPIANQKGFAAVFNNDYSFSTSQSIPVKNTSGVFTFLIPKKGHYKLALAQQNSTAVNFMIMPGKNLLYLNKTIVPMNFVLLRDEKRSADSYLAFYVPDVESFSYKLLHPDCNNTISLYNSAGKEVKPDLSGSPYNITYKTAAADRNNFMYYSNSLFRWPPNIKNVIPYYFFLKFPIKK